MEERVFIENGEASQNGFTNGTAKQQSGPVPREKLPLLEIKADMPHWLRFRRLIENEKRKKINKEIEEKDALERNKYKGVPAWKIPVLVQRDEQKRKQQNDEAEARQEEDTLRAEWDAMPAWKQQLLLKKGFHPLRKRLSVDMEKPALKRWLYGEPAAASPAAEVERQLRNDSNSNDSSSSSSDSVDDGSYTITSEEMSDESANICT